MKKILIIILAGVLLHPLPTKAQFGQDAAALIDSSLRTSEHWKPCPKRREWKYPT